MSEIIHDHSFTLFIETDPLNQTQSSPIWLGQLVLWIQHLSLMRLELQTGYHGYLAFTLFSGSLNYSCFKGKGFNHRGSICLDFILQGPHVKNTFI